MITRNGPVNGDGIDLALQVGDLYAGFIHSHYDRTDMLSVFSVDDLISAWKMFDNINMTQPEKNFFMGVVTADNTTYLLTIEDLGKFITFGENNLSTPLQINAVRNHFNNLGIISSAPIEHQRNMLAQFLQTFNTGMKLMQGNYLNFYGWDTVDVGDNGVTTNYCP